MPGPSSWELTKTFYSYPMFQGSWPSLWAPPSRQARLGCDQPGAARFITATQSYLAMNAQTVKSCKTGRLWYIAVVTCAKAAHAFGNTVWQLDRHIAHSSIQSVQCCRFAMMVVDMNITKWEVESGASLECSTADRFLADLS